MAGLAAFVVEPASRVGSTAAGVLAAVIDHVIGHQEPRGLELVRTVNARDARSEALEQLHRKLAMEAVQEHLSLNQYVVRRLTNAS